MKLQIVNVVARVEDQDERPILGTPLSLTVTMGRWAKESKSSDEGMKTFMVDFVIDVNLRQLSRDQLGDLARDIVYAVVDDDRWKETFAPYVRKVSHFDVDYFPRLFAEGVNAIAHWDWGNKWSLTGSMGPNQTESYDRQTLAPADMFNPLRYTLEELSGALRCSVGLMTAYVHGKLKGGMEWSHLDTIHAQVIRDLPRTDKVNTLPAAASALPIQEWQAEVAAGRTTFGYEVWLRNELNSGEHNAT